MVALLTPGALISTRPNSRCWEWVAVRVSPTSCCTVSNSSSGATARLSTSILTNSSAYAISSAGPVNNAGSSLRSAGQCRYAGS